MAQWLKPAGGFGPGAGRGSFKRTRVLGGGGGGRLKRSSVISDWMFLCFAVLITVCGMYIYVKDWEKELSLRNLPRQKSLAKV